MNRNHLLRTSARREQHVSPVVFTGSLFCLLWIAMLLATTTPMSAQARIDDNLRQKVIGTLERIAKQEDQVRYRGQYAELIPLGTEVEPILLQILTNEDVPIAQRRRSANALQDVATEILIPDLESVIGDLLLEPWVETEIGLILARLGQRKYLDRWLRQVRTVTELPPTTVNLAEILEALTRLGDLQFRSDDLIGAGATHRRRIALLQDLIPRVHATLQQPLTDEMWAIHYNLACCLALSEDIPGAFKALEKSLRSTTIRLSMAQVDGDLKRMRQDPQWNAWVARQTDRSEPTTEKEQEKR